MPAWKADRKMTRICNISYIRLARLQALLMSMVGLVCGLLYAFGGAVYDLVSTGSWNAGTALAFLALLGMPLAFAVVGGILGFVQAMLFNLIAPRFGGVEVELTP